MKNKTVRFLTLILACIMLVSVISCKRQETPDVAPDVPPEETRQSAPPTTPPLPNGKQENPVIEGDYISTSSLIEDLRGNFAKGETVVYEESLWGVPRDKEFAVDLEFDIINDTEYESTRQVFCVYADAELTQPVSLSFEILKNEDDPSIPVGHNRLCLRPGNTAAGRVWGSYYDIVSLQLVTLDESGEYYLHEAQPGTTWGFLSRYYLALHVDTKTSETLEKPIVTIFTIENQLDAPQSRFFVAEDGRAGFQWDAIEDADYYLIVSIDEGVTALSYLSPIDRVSGTEWIHPVVNAGVTMNRKFRYLGGIDNKRYCSYTVIAVNSETHSPMGTLHSGEEIAWRLPYVLAYDVNRAEATETGGDTKFVPAVGLLPMQRAIEMTNGEIIHRRMLYDFDGVEVKEDRYTNADYGPDGELVILGFTFSTNLYVPFSIEGTSFSNVMVVEGIDTDNLDKYMDQLSAIRRQMEESSPRGGGSSGISVNNLKQMPDAPSIADAPSEILDRTGDRVFANSALGAYLALNMLAGNELIDLTGFPESADWEYLLDAFFEALYQNPLILHVEGAGAIPGTNIFIVQYGESPETIARQQDAIRLIVPEIIRRIIKSGMSDLEKSFAINTYLVDNAEYDFAALENAEKNNFQGVDAIFNDSFTAYGILVNKVGVCAGYAAAYKLLADEAGLDSIVVTGYLEGYLPHAWNRVNIEGNWHTIDVTNNNNSYIFNAIMHLPDYAASSVLVEDSRFMMDDFLADYTSEDNSSEFYNVTGRLYDKSAIASELAGAIRQNGSATLRTYYDLDDITFYEIALEVMELLGKDEIFGFHWLGVIWMSDSV